MLKWCKIIRILIIRIKIIRKEVHEPKSGNGYRAVRFENKNT